MNKKNVGVISIGIKAPMIKRGDCIRDIVFDSVINSGIKLDDKDVIGITESVVARANGNYVTVDDIVQFMDERNFPKHLVLYSPIMSRNRFSLILKGFARYANSLTILLEGVFDEQGNPNYGINQFTGVDIQEYYKELCKSENCSLIFLEHKNWEPSQETEIAFKFIDCRCHPNGDSRCTLANIMNEPVVRKDGSVSGFNKEYGLLGSNKSGDETLKLFPKVDECENLVVELQYLFKVRTGKDVEVMIYADGCFKDPVGGIWEFADPVTSPAYTEGLNGTPNEIKLKYLIDTIGEEKALKAVKENKNKDLKGNMLSQGTTPRRYVDLLASLMDLTSGSGDRCTPIILIKNYL